MAVAIGKPIKPQIAAAGGLPRVRACRCLAAHGAAHTTMTDGYDPWPKNWELGYDPADPLDAAVIATRKAVFPLHGLPLDNWQGF